MRTLPLLLLPGMLLSQVPGADFRNIHTPHTDTHFRMPHYPTVESWEARKEDLRARILRAAGLDPMPRRNPLNPRIGKRIEREGYSVESVLIETLPGYYLGGNLYRPLGKSGKFPGIVSPHGHWKRGRLENTESCSVPGRGINLARQGYVVFAYDMVGYNDTRQTPHDFGGRLEQLWSFTPMGLQLWNSIRALDFVESLPEVDGRRLAATGASGGGTQTFLLAAVDSRIGFAAPVNMVSAIMQGGCVCENGPGLRHGVYNVEIGAMMAPKPLLMVSATGDWTRNTPKEEFPDVRRIYELYGKPENVENVHVDAKHNYNRESREAVYSFFARRILGDSNPEPYKEKEFIVEKDEDLLALSGQPLPENALTYEGLFNAWKAEANHATGTLDPHRLRLRMAGLFGGSLPAKVSSEVHGDALLLSPAGSGERVPAVWQPGRGAAVLVVHPEGSGAALKTSVVQKLREAGRPVLAIDAFQTGLAMGARDRSARHFLTFNQTEDGHRVRDILTALAFLKMQNPGRIEVVGLESAGPWCLFAAATAGGDLRLTVDLKGFEGADQDFAERFFVPGIQKAGGLRVAMRLTEGMR